MYPRLPLAFKVVKLRYAHYTKRCWDLFPKCISIEQREILPKEVVTVGKLKVGLVCCYVVLGSLYLFPRKERLYLRGP